MQRWKPDPKRRLYEAALSLFEEKGYATTTTSDIARLAGLTERTLFRYFKDKREILFQEEEHLQTVSTRTILDVPDAEPVFAAVVQGLMAVCRILETQRSLLVRRTRIVKASPDLQERELAKLAAWSTSVAKVLEQRGASSREASIASEIGFNLLRIAFRSWLEEETKHSLQVVLEQHIATSQELVRHSGRKRLKTPG